MSWLFRSIAFAVALGVHVHASAQTSQKALAPKGSVSVAKDQPITMIESDPSSTRPPRVREAGTLASAEQNKVLRVPLALEANDDKEDLKSVRVVEGKGKVELVGGRPMLEQKSFGTTVLSSGSATTIAQDSTLSTERKTGLPWVVIDVKRDATSTIATPMPPVVRTARPFLLLAHAVQWVPSTQQYVAEFFVGLDPEAESLPGKLEEPFTASLSVSCDAVDPSSVKLAHIGPEGDHKVRVTCSPRMRLAGKQQLTVRIASGQLSYPFELPANPGPFALASSAQEIPGLGLSTVRLTVSQALEDGSPLVESSDTEVPLRSTTGELHPAALIIPKGKSDVSMDVRVFGVGPMTVQAGLGPRISMPLAIERAWPTFFLIITLLGGAAGGYLAVLRQQRTKAQYARSSKRLARRVMEGSLVGLVTVGVLLTTPMLSNWMPDIARGSQLAWFSAAVLSGFLGVELIERLASRFVSQEPAKT